MCNCLLNHSNYINVGLWFLIILNFCYLPWFLIIKNEQYSSLFLLYKGLMWYLESRMGFLLALSDAWVRCAAKNGFLYEVSFQYLVMLNNEKCFIEGIYLHQKGDKNFIHLNVQPLTFYLFKSALRHCFQPFNTKK